MRGALFRPAIAARGNDTHENLSSTLAARAPLSTRRSKVHEPAPISDDPFAPATSVSSDDGSQAGPADQDNPADQDLKKGQQLPPIAKSFAQAAEAAGVPYIGQLETRPRLLTPQGAVHHTQGCGEEAETGDAKESEGAAGWQDPCAGVGEREAGAGDGQAVRRLPLPRQLEQVQTQVFWCGTILLVWPFPLCGGSTVFALRSCS